MPAIMANPTPAPNELGSHPACAKRDRAAAREKPAGIAVGSPSQEGSGCWGTIRGYPQAWDPRIMAVLVGHGAKSQAETPSMGLSTAGGMTEPSLAQTQNGARAQGISFSVPLPTGNPVTASQRMQLMGSGCFPRKAHRDIPGRPHVLLTSQDLHPSSFPAGPTPAQYRWRTDAASTGVASSPRPTNLPHAGTPPSFCPQCGGGDRNSRHRFHT